MLISAVINNRIGADSASLVLLIIGGKIEKLDSFLGGFSFTLLLI